MFRVGDRPPSGPVPPYIELPGQPPSVDVLADLAAAGRPVLLSFSRGKDSVATWLALREAGVEVVPFHMYSVPGLAFVDDSVAMFEDYFGCRIIQIPHPRVYRWLSNFVFQVPERIATIRAAELPEPSYAVLEQLVLEQVGLPADTWVADGTRAADSPNRRIGFTRFGPWRDHGDRHKVFPVWDWRSWHVKAALHRHKAPLPVDYEWFGRSFDGIDFRYLEPLSRHAPDDYARILAWFPLAELELFRARLVA